MSSENRASALAALAAAVSALLAFASAGSTEGIAYRGRIVAVQANATSEHTPIPMTFRLYGEAQGGMALWGRKHAVPVDANGVFNVVLENGSGTAVEGTPFADLADALASVTNAWIGLTPGNVTDDDASLEFTPRQRLAAVPSVHRTTVARAADRLEVPELVCDTLDVRSNLTVRTLDVASVADGIGLSKMKLELNAGTLLVEGGAVRCQGFNPPMTAPLAVTRDNEEVQRLAIGTNATSDVQSVFAAFLPVGERAGADVTHVQQIGGGTTTKGGAQ